MLKRTYKKILAQSSPRTLVGATLVLIYVLFTINMIWLYKTVAYNSDDTAQLAMLQYYSPGLLPSWMPPDPFIFKLPFNVIADWLFGNSTRALFVSALLANMVSFALVYIVSLKMLALPKSKKANKKIALFSVSFVALTLIPSLTFMFSLRSPHIRTIEIGLAFLALYVVIRYWYQGRLMTRRASILAILLLSVFFYNDPGFVFFLALPTILYSGYRFLETLQDKYAYVGGIFLASVVGYRIVSFITEKVGFRTYHTNGNFPPIESMQNNLTVASDAVLKFFNADFLGRSVDSGATIVKLVYLALLVIAIASIYVSFKKGADIERLLAVICVLTVLAFAFSNRATDPYSARYIIIVPFILPIFVYLAITRYFTLPWKRIGGAVVIGVFALNIGLSSYKAVNAISQSSNPNAITDDIKKAINDNSLKSTKGYAGYFMANVSSYLSDTEHQIIPIICDPAENRVFYWVMYEGGVDRDSDSSYVIVSDENLLPDITVNSENIKCTKEEAMELFGKPKEDIFVRNNTSIFYYDYDIGAKLQPRLQQKSP